MEIYVDNLAGMQFRNINKMIEQTRIRLQNKGISDEDHYMKTLQAATISEDNISLCPFHQLYLRTFHIEWYMVIFPFSAYKFCNCLFLKPL